MGLLAFFDNNQFKNSIIKLSGPIELDKKSGFFMSQQKLLCWV